MGGVWHCRRSSRRTNDDGVFAFEAAGSCAGLPIFGLLLKTRQIK